MSGWKLPALEHAPHSGCLNCGPKPLRVPLRYNPHPGFGCVTLSRDGEVVWSCYRAEDSRTFITFERRAAADPEHDWRVFIDGPLSDVTYQRHGPKEWVAVERGMGFA